jgi:hypothetical protein
MQVSLSPNLIVQSFLKSLRRYHVVLFSVFVLGGLAAAVFLLNNTLVTASTPANPAGGALDFDQQTLKEIEAMHTSDQVTSENKEELSLKINQTRTNPLVAQ